MNRLLVVCVMLLSCAGNSAGADPVTEWQVPWTDGRPRDPYLDPQGNVWFCGQGGGYLARLDPVTGNFVGHLDVTTGAVRLVKLQTPNARPRRSRFMALRHGRG